MVLLEDPLTGDVPSRFQTEEDEELAQSLVQQYSAQPVIEVRVGVMGVPCGKQSFLGA